MKPAVCRLAFPEAPSNSHRSAPESATGTQMLRLQGRSSPHPVDTRIRTIIICIRHLMRRVTAPGGRAANARDNRRHSSSTATLRRSGGGTPCAAGSTPRLGAAAGGQRGPVRSRGRLPGRRVQSVYPTPVPGMLRKTADPHTSRLCSDGCRSGEMPCASTLTRTGAARSIRHKSRSDPRRLIIEHR